jgi:hypothetical protein
MSSHLFSKKDTRYNGWKNYETWSIALFFDNSECLQNEITEICHQDKDDYDISCDIRDFVEENYLTYNLMPEQQQMIQAFIDEVDFMELLKHYKGDKNG